MAEPYTYNPDVRPILDDWLNADPGDEQGALKHQARLLIADLERQLAQSRKKDCPAWIAESQVCCEAESYEKAIEELDHALADAKQLRRRLRLIQGMAGNPDAAEACRLIIAEAAEALAAKEAPTPVEHVCGLSGFGQPGDKCQACENDRERWW